MWQSQKSPWTNTRLHHHLECQLYILVLNKMADLSPSAQFFWLRARSIVLLVILHQIRPVCVKAHAHGAYSSVVGLSASEQACCQWAGSPRDQPLEREGGPVSWRGLESRPYIQTVILTGLGVGNSFASLKILCFPEQKQAHSVIFIYNKRDGPV